MKSTILLIASLLISMLPNSGRADESIKTVKSKLNEATVFLKGAELTHTATTGLVSGYNEIKIEKLSPAIDRNSLKIKTSDGVLISAFEFSVDEVPIKKLNESRVVIMKDSIEGITEDLAKLRAEMKIDGELLQIMKKGIDRNVSDTLSITDLMKVMEYYQNKSREIELRQISNQKKQKGMERKMAEINLRLKKESIQEYEKSGVLRINCSSPLATNCTFTISYYTPSAQWTPYYDINVVSTDKPIKIVTKAKVRQTTTVDWSKVKLTLSTATPSNGKSAPLFSAWFLQYADIQLRSQNISGLMQNMYSYSQASSKAVSKGFSADEVLQEYESVEKSVNPIYVVSGVVVDENYYRSLDPSMIKDVTTLAATDATPIYGSNASGGAIVVSLKNSMDDYVTTQENALNLVYTIDLPYTIPGDGKEQSIEVKTNETSAEYKYYCAPKLDTETYLLAEIADWEKLNLLSGKANITYDGTYIGETVIQSGSTEKKLSLTLGVDKRVSVKRELIKDFNSKKSSNSDNKQEFRYKITVKNNQNKAINMVLKDQYPKSNNREIETELLLKETTPPTYNNEDVGVITWEENINAGESKTYELSYTVKYPKGRSVNL